MSARGILSGKLPGHSWLFMIFVLSFHKMRQNRDGFSGYKPPFFSDLLFLAWHKSVIPTKGWPFSSFRCTIYFVRNLIIGTKDAPLLTRNLAWLQKFSPAFPPAIFKKDFSKTDKKHGTIFRGGRLVHDCLRFSAPSGWFNLRQFFFQSCQRLSNRRNSPGYGLAFSLASGRTSHFFVPLHYSGRKRTSLATGVLPSGKKRDSWGYSVLLLHFFEPGGTEDRPASG